MVFLLLYQQSSKQCIFSVLKSRCLYFFPCFNALLPLERIYHKIWHEVKKYAVETDTTYVHETCIVCSLDWWKSLESQWQIWKVWFELKNTKTFPFNWNDYFWYVVYKCLFFWQWLTISKIVWNELRHFVKIFSSETTFVSGSVNINVHLIECWVWITQNDNYSQCFDISQCHGPFNNIWQLMVIRFTQTKKIAFD